MISLKVEKRYGPATVRARISAPSVERALELCGDDARVASPTGLRTRPIRLAKNLSGGGLARSVA
jgi:hypothetical protein